LYPSSTSFATFSITFTMPPRKCTRPFKAPRQATVKGATSQDVGPRKRMERQLELIEKRQNSFETRHSSSEDDVPIVSQIQLETARKGKGIKMMSEREADETAKFGEVLRWSTDSDSGAVRSNDTILSKTNEEESVKHKDVGMKIARDFGKKGAFLGKVVAVEYDSEDVDKNEDIFVVEYTDGDREDMNKEELVYTHEFTSKSLASMTTPRKTHFTPNRAKRKVTSLRLRLVYFVLFPLFLDLDFVPYTKYRRKKDRRSRVGLTTSPVLLMMRRHQKYPLTKHDSDLVHS
jgi:hypothetical protein